MIGCYGSAGEAVRGAMQHSGTCYRFLCRASLGASSYAWAVEYYSFSCFIKLDYIWVTVNQGESSNPAVLRRDSNNC